jgi:hypothetical protein
MKSLLVVTLLAVTLAACGSSDGDDNVIVKDVDVAAWKAELVRMPGVGGEPDMAKLEEITRSDCATPVKDLALRFGLEGSDPDVTRLNMTYVCPRLASKVDQALALGREATTRVEDACALTPAERTEDEQALVELAGRDC